jgi:hypothetical protein
MLTHREAQFTAALGQLLAPRAPVYGVFIQPRAQQDLGDLVALARGHVIDDEAIAVGRRASRARQIISEVVSDLEGASRSQIGHRPRRGPG